MASLQGRRIIVHLFPLYQKCLRYMGVRRSNLLFRRHHHLRRSNLVRHHYHSRMAT